MHGDAFSLLAETYTDTNRGDQPTDDEEEGADFVAEDWDVRKRFREMDAAELQRQLRPARTYCLLLVEPLVEKSGMWRRVGVAIAYHTSGLNRFGALDFKKASKVEDIVLV